MKLNNPQAKSYLAGQSLSPATLVYGENTTQSRNFVQKLILNALGENAQSEMRLEQIEAREAIKDGALLGDALRSSSFFPGARGVVIYEASDALAEVINQALEGWQDNDAHVFIQAGNLRKTSKLRKLFEPHPQTAVIALYDDPLTPAELREKAKNIGLSLADDAFEMLMGFCANYEKSAVDSLLDQLSLYHLSGEPLTADELEALLPGQYAGKTDDIINALFEGDFSKLINELRRAPAQGISLRQLNMLAIWRAHQLAKLFASSNPAQAIGQLRPPVFGVRRQALERNIRNWRPERLETALVSLNEAEKELRSGKVFIPETAFLERVFLRVARLAR